RTSVALESTASSSCLLTLDVDDATRASSDLTIEAHDESGALLLHWSTDYKLFRPKWSANTGLTLPAGPVVIDAWTSSGLRGRTSGVVGGSPEPFTISLR